MHEVESVLIRVLTSLVRVLIYHGPAVLALSVLVQLTLSKSRPSGSAHNRYVVFLHCA
jgi:hypothetical protein